MRILGIIGEYNPFHLGHALHLQKSLEIVNPDLTIVLLAGNWTQRGEPAIVSKWVRSRWPMEFGADMVLDFPFSSAVASAKDYGNNALSILSAVGITHLSFGTERLHGLPQEELFRRGAYLNRLHQQMPGMKKAIAPGLSLFRYTKNRLEEDGEWELAQDLATPNSLLGLEYIQSILRRNVSIIPIPIHRGSEKMQHHTLEEDGISGTAIRKALYQGKSVEHRVPPQVKDDLDRWKESGYHFPRPNDLIPFFQGDCLFPPPKIVYGQEKGLDKFYSQRIFQDKSQLPASSRYTRSRIQRYGIHRFLRSEDLGGIAPEAQWIRPLAINQKGAEYLKTRLRSLDPLVRPGRKEKYDPSLTGRIFRLEHRASEFYSLLTGFPSGEEWTRRLWIKKGACD